jgi:diguanylate cyclase (GGDEF)-like protein/PAS domain S-box-containing protein
MKIPSVKHPERLMFAVMLLGMAASWGLVTQFTLAERAAVIRSAGSELYNTVETLADFSNLEETYAGGAAKFGAPDRTAALWRVLLQYPTATIWIEKNGVTTTGQAPATLAADMVEESATSGAITVHAALPEKDVLSGWRAAAVRRGETGLAVTVVFIALIFALARAMRRRTAAERDSAVAEERIAQLAQYREVLEKTVTERTTELKGANGQLHKELAERKAAEEALRQHDALLNAVTRGAGELLSAQSLGDSMTVVFEMISHTMSLSRIQLAAVRPDREGRLRSSTTYEWCAPGVRPMIDNALLQDLDLTENFPRLVGPIANGEISSAFFDEAPETYRNAFAAADMRSFLHVPVMIDGKLSGLLSFIDSADRKREWSWAETDTLRALARLIGSATGRERYIKDLANANMIVQNSPTFLFRLKGEPSLPLIYISPNIAKFGYDPVSLVASPTWFMTLIDAEDQERFSAGMARMLQKDSKAATIEFRMKGANGEQRWIEARYSPVRDKTGRLAEIEGIMIDVTERKAAEDKISQLARTDGLTGLANRTTFVERLNQAFVAARRGEMGFAVLYLDLDHFKDINDTLGHPVGDQLLKAAGDRLRGAVRETDVVARLGGDEFAVLQFGVSDPATAGALAAKIHAALGAPYQIADNALHVTTSIGVAPLQDNVANPDVLLSQADLALYRAKEEGRDQYRFHTADLDSNVRERVSLAEDLRRAIEGHELELHYQSQVDLASGAIVGMEVLVRWNHPTRGLLLPAAFIPTAEKTGSILALGHWVLDGACAQMRAWKDAGIAPPVIAVNVSLLQLKNAREFIADVTQTLAKWKLEPADLELDVTELMLAQVGWAQNDVLAQLRELGVKIALDDFGTDYSSFDYVRTYKVNHLKIARTFIDAAAHDPESAATIRAIIGLAHELGIEVIAEGVETAEQRAMLQSIGEHMEAQGFYFSQPVGHGSATEMLEREPKQPVVAPAATKPRKRSASATPGRRRT